MRTGYPSPLWSQVPVFIFAKLVIFLSKDNSFVHWCSMFNDVNDSTNKTVLYWILQIVSNELKFRERHFCSGDHDWLSQEKYFTNSYDFRVSRGKIIIKQFLSRYDCYEFNRVSLWRFVRRGLCRRQLLSDFIIITTNKNTIYNRGWKNYYWPNQYI